ncbi:class I SAM-dependent methyltransferase [Rossellomorea vietnamensis]|uniref:Class I SAM-dependent methyltransferase n=2 Tax=Rossellomorea vietnamensis TaxID=218284 RepID=A0A5D4NSP6_9BACI|nr:class I SAM-dependent methyltransferase [Rossellomorea vietnamensis]
MEKVTEMKTYWDEQYSKVSKLWGFKPKETLVQYKNLIPKQGKVLDLGVGEGRNALYFAAHGFTVEGVDISTNAIERCRTLAEEAGLNILTLPGDLRNFHIEKNSYSLIILSNILNFFNKDEISEIIQSAKEGLVDQGLIYINAFDIFDPGYEKSKKDYEEVSLNTFYRPNSDSFMHFFTKSELESYFTGYKAIKASQTYSLDLGHGEPHYHGTIELLLQKKAVFA